MATYVAARHVSAEADFLLVQYYADRTPAGSLPWDFAALPPDLNDTLSFSTKEHLKALTILPYAR